MTSTNSSADVLYHTNSKQQKQVVKVIGQLEMWANVMVALSNIGGALCSTPQSLADAHY